MGQRIHPYWKHPRTDLIEARVTRIKITKENGKPVKDIYVSLWWKGQVYNPVRGIVTKTLRRKIKVCGVPLTNTNNASLVVDPNLPIRQARIGLTWPEEKGKVHWGN